MCDTLPKKERERIKSSAWNSAKTDNCTTLPSNVSYSFFLPQIFCVLSILFFLFT
ncbi:hypothetical protein AB205_0072930 [Aquarana catesbeiana]|uniref:Uncharacterized protein n=1 Tax=Aquarana catesbeiana TaxID=8400 RepID=A0A2G9QCD7_AQUCT|nr:hypothetical protein AB205_0072930 [Aquarana catesbeiana]